MDRRDILADTPPQTGAPEALAPGKPLRLYPILIRLSRSRIAALRLAARRGRSISPRSSAAVLLVSSGHPPRHGLGLRRSLTTVTRCIQRYWGR
jgi:hypothetical protein